MTVDPCGECRVRPSLAGSFYCQACVDRLADQERRGRLRQKAKLMDGGHARMWRWTIATFPADDAAGRAALTAAEPWLWAHTGHRLRDGQLVKISDQNPDPEIDRDDHPIWKWFHGDETPNLYVYGPVGVGKTGLAWSLFRARVELIFDWEDADEDPAFVNVVELLDKAKAAMKDGDGGAVIRQHYDASLLVLDDLGAERPSEWGRDAIAALVQHRHTRRRPTIVTSNYAPSALAKRLGRDDLLIGQRIVSRLTDHCIKAKLERADLRLRIAA